MKNIYFILSMLIILGLTAIFIPTNKDSSTSIFDKSVLFLEENEKYNLPLDDKLEISISNEGIVKIEGKTISAIGIGHTEVTIIKDDSETSLDIYVIDLSDAFTKKEITIGEKFKITFAEKTNLTFDDFIWEIENQEIISLENNTFTGLNEGKTKIIATLKKDSTIKIEFDIKVIPNSNLMETLIEIALNEEGYVEGANNYTKYGAWYGLPNSEWCAMFVSWSANQANIPTNIIPKFAFVKSGKTFFEEQGRYYDKESYIPQRGDIIFFLNGISHTAIVTKVENGKVYTIEGNTANKVAQRNYSLNDSLISGYGNPNY